MFQPKRPRSALTLTELLVVVAIVIVVAGTMVPMIRPILKGRNVREAARIVNVAFASAQSRAIEKQRPYGIWLERAAHKTPTSLDASVEYSSINPTADMYKVFKLYTAKQPPPYSGDTVNARARVITFWDNSADKAGFPPAVIPVDPTYAAVVVPLKDAVSFSLLNPGEKIQFGDRGGLYEILPVPSIPYRIPNNPAPGMPMLPPFDQQGNLVVIYIRPLPDNVFYPSQLPVNAGNPQALALDQLANHKHLGRLQGQIVPFKVFRQPRKTTAAPIEMPNGTTIDLSLSGIAGDNRTKFRYGDGMTEVHPGQDIVIMFNPSGGVQGVYYINSDIEHREYKYATGAKTFYTGTQFRTVDSEIALLVGRDAQVGLDQNDLPAPFTCELSTGLGGLPPESIRNLADTTNIWMTIEGNRVTNSPNAGFNPSDPNPFESKLRPVFYDVHIRHARQLTRSGLGMGGE